MYDKSMYIHMNISMIRTNMHWFSFASYVIQPSICLFLQLYYTACDGPECETEIYIAIAIRCIDIVDYS